MTTPRPTQNFSEEQRKSLNAYLKKSRELADQLTALGSVEEGFSEVLEEYEGDRDFLQNIVDNIRSSNALLSNFQRDLAQFYSKVRKKNNELLNREKSPNVSNVTGFKDLI